DLKLKLEREVEMVFSGKHICDAIYRPFTKLKLYGQNPVVDREGTIQFFPTKKCLQENRAISLSDVGLRSPFSCLTVSLPSDLHLCASTDGFQNFPLLTYSEDGKERRDNITPKALTLFQIFYDDDGITRADIFHYVYALLHHPAYRTRYAENLKRELPRIPFIGVGDEVTSLKSKGKKLETPHVVSYEGKFYPLAA